VALNLTVYPSTNSINQTCHLIIEPQEPAGACCSLTPPD
jgi:hypothetical protein